MSAEDVIYERSAKTQNNGYVNLPCDIRDALDVSAGEDEVGYELRTDGTVVLKKREQAEP